MGNNNNQKIKKTLKFFFIFLLSFFIVYSVALKERELTPRLFAKKLFNLLPRSLYLAIEKKRMENLLKKTVKSSFAKEKMIKEKLYYNGEEFEVLIDPSIELTQEKIKFLYQFYKLVNKNTQ